MTITSVAPIGCEEQKTCVEAAPTVEERIPLTALPKLAWVGAGLFVANVMIGCMMLITPSLDTDPYGREVRSYDTASIKMSPFTPVVDENKRKVRLAAKAVPMTFVPAPEDFSTFESASLDMQRSTPASQLDLPRSSSRQLDIPRASRAYQELDIPVRSERALYRPNDQRSLDLPRATYMPRRAENSADVAPRRSSERDTRIVVIN